MFKSCLISIACVATMAVVSFGAQAEQLSQQQTACNVSKAAVSAGTITQLRKKARSGSSENSLSNSLEKAQCATNTALRLSLLDSAIQSGSLLVKKMPKSGFTGVRAGW